jgi:outer membrane protein TolC
VVSPRLETYQEELAARRAEDSEAAKIDPDRVYGLPELIDIAERTNPQTRIAWERARQAAAAVGLSESTYYPYLAASAFAGYEKAFIPFPALEQGPGPADVSVVGGGGPGLRTEVGARRARREMAAPGFRRAERDEDRGRGGADGRERRVQRRPSAGRVRRSRGATTNSTRHAESEAARSRQRAANTVAESARLRLEHGLATRPEVLQAEEAAARRHTSSWPRAA